MARLGLLFVLIPVLELILLVRLGQWIGLFPTVLIVVGTGLIGALLVRREGLRALLAVQMELARGQLPTRPILDGVAVLVGGAFLLTPGILTDAAGLLLLLPPTRRIIHRWAQARLAQAVARGTVRVSAWGLEGWRSSRPSASGTSAEGSSKGDTGSPLGSTGEGAHSSAQGGDRPPRPGEIIQE